MSTRNVYHVSHQAAPSRDGESDMGTITATNGTRIEVDDDNVEALRNFRWTINGDGYATRTVMHGKIQEKLGIHRQVMGLRFKDGKLIDHKNGNPLDNRRENLRICTRQQNIWNTRRRQSRWLKGVKPSRTKAKWIAAIGHNGRRIYLGTFETEQLAHEFYCLAADLLRGEFSIHGA
jgi:hypothetical protein